MRNLVAPLLVALVAACSAAGSPARDCTRGSDCASGVCNEDGTCGAGAAGGAAGSAGAGAGGDVSMGGAAGSGDAGAGGSSADAGAAGTSSGTCSPNHDGQITRDETPLGAGLSAKFRVATNVTAATAGVKQPDGSVAWDFSPMVASDHDSLLEALPITGAWYQAQFPGASYAMKVSDAQDLLGVFEITDTSLLLRGIVSPTSSATQTELTYTPPVTVLQFPLKIGSSWTTQSTVTGTLNGVPSTYFENYAEKVDLSGQVKVPYGVFPVLRVGVVLTQTIGALVTVRRSYLFSTECFGTIAKMASQDDEPNTEFSSVSELSRLTP